MVLVIETFLPYVYIFFPRDKENNLNDDDKNKIYQEDADVLRGLNNDINSLPKDMASLHKDDRVTGEIRLAKEMRRRSKENKERLNLGNILFYSILFYSILFYSILFYSTKAIIL